MSTNRKKKLTEVISVRLPAHLHAKFYAEHLATKESIGVVVRRHLEQSDLENCVISQPALSVEEMERLAAATATLKQAKPAKAPDELRKLQYLYNKTSNNMNQLAHRANSDYLAGKLSESTYSSILAELSEIRRALLSGLEE